MYILAIDPGTNRSAVVLVAQGGPDPGSPPMVIRAALLDNEDVRDLLHENDGPWYASRVVIEMVACYGQRVGREVFETCVWIGRFLESTLDGFGVTPQRLVRRDVKMHLCNTNRANDADVRAALIDLYGPGKEKAIGLKKSPGPLYGFKKDMWAALGVAVTYAKQLEA